MGGEPADEAGGALVRWRDGGLLSSRRRGRRVVATVGSLRFAFYGRLSTKEHQDVDTSRRWQLENAVQVIGGAGTIVVEFLDVGFTRRRPWLNRPQAAPLLAAVTGGAYGFDAVVVGEYERAFCGRQVFQIAELLREHGVQLWLPETLGPVDLDDPAHRAVLIELGARSLREVQRARRRATDAMRVQAQVQGRFLGGRPPYGYRLVDAGPHPTASHARWGRQVRRLDPDPVTAAHVRWIYAQRLAGWSMTGIARDLNERQVPCPSAQDRARNGHRGAAGWTVTTIAAILANPRYTGRQVWNRQSVHHPSPDGVQGSAGRRRGWNCRRDWVISDAPAHPALVDEATFIAVQTVTAVASPADGSVRCYRLVGVLRCAVCGRRLTSHWAHGRAWYRCEHGYTGATVPDSGRARTLYRREDKLVVQIIAILPAVHHRSRIVGVDVAAVLRDCDLVAVCDWNSVTLETA